MFFSNRIKQLGQSQGVMLRARQLVLRCNDLIHKLRQIHLLAGMSHQVCPCCAGFIARSPVTTAAFLQVDFKENVRYPISAFGMRRAPRRVARTKQTVTACLWTPPFASQTCAAHISTSELRGSQGACSCMQMHSCWEELVLRSHKCPAQSHVWCFCWQRCWTMMLRWYQRDQFHQILQQRRKHRKLFMLWDV